MSRCSGRTNEASRSLSFNPGDALTETALAVALRLAGKTGEAAAAVDQALQTMPLLPQARAEQWLQTQFGGRKAAVTEASGKAGLDLGESDVQDYLEAAAWYLRLDDLRSSFEV